MARTSDRPRPPQGAHVLKLRMDAGLTQAELAELVGETQQNIAFWERSEKPPRSEVLPAMAKAMGVSVEDILLPSKAKEASRRRGGPVGKVQKAFEDVSRLPRNQQEKVLEFINMFVSQYKRSAS